MDPQLLGIVSECRTLCLDIASPGWDGARGYLFDPEAMTLYFPVSPKYLHGRDLNQYEVLIWSRPRVLMTGRLSPATSPSDIERQRELATGDGLDGARIEVLLFDQRHHKPRKNRHKLQVASLTERTT